MGGASRTDGRDERFTQGFDWKNLNGIDSLWYLDT
jgi:hypothetical protein